ncbi:zf-RVT domain-containing protein [Cucumis melo var. makuwa]|uniref:Zf-RVT domain-containing protein n=1 Tax=Cucumis melo var. makuwa TaxID=1194695 RepID=A0A5D3DSS6_CUCMM|nr:zf-RVT domain-containing protein [Cucumis melo var. makuwa]
MVSVIYSIVQEFSSLHVHHEVDKILRSYLWKGKEEGRGGVKVAWAEVCLPFEEGGLAIRDGPSWNITSTMKILLLLLASSASLWMAWAKAYILKERSLWAVNTGIGRSWCLRAILHKRDSLKEHVWMRVGDGRRCRVWLDPWLQGGLILEVVSRLRVRGILFVIGVVGFIRQVYCGLGGMSPSILFLHGWPLKIDWALEIDCIGEMSGLESYRLWLPPIGLGIEGLSCLGFAVRVFGRVCGGSYGAFSSALLSTLSGKSLIIISMVVRAHPCSPSHTRTPRHTQAEFLPSKPHAYMSRPSIFVEPRVPVTKSRASRVLSARAVPHFKP